MTRVCDPLPKSAILIDRTVVEYDGRSEFKELASNRAGTRFWLWRGKYVQKARGPERMIRTCRELTAEEAQDDLLRTSPGLSTFA